MQEAKVSQAIGRFNERDFLAAGELFEAIWREAGEGERPLYEAMVRMAAALHMRLDRGGFAGSKNLLQQALVRLDDLRPECARIDTEKLYADLTTYLERLRANRAGPTWRERRLLPKIKRR